MTAPPTPRPARQKRSEATLAAAPDAAPATPAKDEARLVAVTAYAHGTYLALLYDHSFGGLPRSSVMDELGRALVAAMQR